MTTTSIFNFQSAPQSGLGSPKLHISSGNLPSYIDPSQPPFKKSPWRQIKEVPFVYSVTLTVPSKLSRSVHEKICAKDNLRTRYAKVTMSLNEVLEGDFFTEYIKKGDIVMLSKPNATSNDIVMTIYSGQLTIDMPSHIYERAGLPNGTAIPSGGRKHTRSRFRVQYDLRSPSMLRGKKAFDRLLKASKEVDGLNESKHWCFADLSDRKEKTKASVDASNTETQRTWDDRPIMKHNPTIVDVEATVTSLQQARVPDVITQPFHLRSQDISEVRTEEDLFEMIEWLDLVKLRSSRVVAGDNPDPFICTYRLPGEEEKSEQSDLVNFTWKGLLSMNWVVNLLIKVIQVSRSTDSKAWACLSVNSYHTEVVGQVNGYLTLLNPAAMPATDQDLDAMQVEGEEKTTTKGLQHFMCFEFVDSLTS